MFDLSVTCPECNHEFKLNETLAAPFIEETRKEFEQKVQKLETDLKVKEKSVKEREAAIKVAESTLEVKIDEKVQTELARISEEEYKKAKDRIGADLNIKIKENQELQNILKEKDQKLVDAQKSQAELIRQQRKLEDEKNALNLTIEEKVQEELQRIRNQARREAEQAFSPKIAQLNQELAEKAQKLADSQQAEAELIRQKRELEEAKSALGLTVEKKVQEGLEGVRNQARKEAEESLSLKVKEKELTISSMQKTIDELKRKSEQGSQQLQGEVQELELEALLRAKFPSDNINPVPKGEFGGDAAHHVLGPLGQICGSILWESKRTKNWSDDWLVKLRDDQRTAKAEIAVLVTQTLPKGVESFSLIDGIWVTHPSVAIPVAIALRQSLIELAMTRQSLEGQQTKMGILYTYLTGPRFRQRVEAIVEAFSSMKEDLEKEKKAINKQWAKRQEQIERVMQATVGMYGDMQGIAGKTLQEIEGLELKSLESPQPELIAET